MWQCVVVRHSFYRCTSCRQRHVRNLSDDCHSNQFRRFSSRLIERPNGMSYYTLSAILRVFDKKVAKSKRCTPSRPQPKREGIIAASIVQRSWKSALANTLFVSAANSSFFFFVVHCCSCWGYKVMGGSGISFRPKKKISVNSKKKKKRGRPLNPPFVTRFLFPFLFSLLFFTTMT